MQQAGGSVGKLTVRRFYRPEDVGRDHAYQADFWELFASEESATLEVDDVFGKCAVVPTGAPAGENPKCQVTFSRCRSSLCWCADAVMA